MRDERRCVNNHKRRRAFRVWSVNWTCRESLRRPCRCILQLQRTFRNLRRQRDPPKTWPPGEAAASFPPRGHARLTLDSPSFFCRALPPRCSRKSSRSHSAGSPASYSPPLGNLYVLPNEPCAPSALQRRRSRRSGFVTGSRARRYCAALPRGRKRLAATARAPPRARQCRARARPRERP